MLETSVKNHKRPLGPIKPYFPGVVGSTEENRDRAVALNHYANRRGRIRNLIPLRGGVKYPAPGPGRSGKTCYQRHLRPHMPIIRRT